VKQLWLALVAGVLLFLLFPYPHALFAPERRVPMLTPGWIEDEAWEAVTDQCPRISPELAPDIAVVRFRAFSPPGLRQLSMDGVGGRIVGGMRPHRVLVRIPGDGSCYASTRAAKILRGAPWVANAIPWHPRDTHTPPPPDGYHYIEIPPPEERR
jgi:hypothetical protein